MTVQKDAFAYAHQVGDSTVKQFQMITSLTAFVTKGTENMKSFDHEYRNLLTALEALDADYLRPYFFQASLLTLIINGISESLWNNFGATIWLAQKDPHYYYHTADFSDIRVNDTSVAITLTFRYRNSDNCSNGIVLYHFHCQCLVTQSMRRY